jgi:hypothetical protein
VSVAVAFVVSDPSTAVTVTVEFAPGALAPAVRFKMAFMPGVMLVGLKTPVTPAGKPATDKVQGPLVDPCIETTNSALSPTGRITEPGSREMFTSAEGGGVVVMVVVPSIPQPAKKTSANPVGPKRVIVARRKAPSGPPRFSTASPVRTAVVRREPTADES